jgi:hypothetical protein
VSLVAARVVYAGSSAGLCVLSPGLHGLEVVDDAGAVTRAYGSEPVWDGLGPLDEVFVPHYRSPGHPETAGRSTPAGIESCGVGRPGREVFVHCPLLEGMTSTGRTAT